MQCLLEIVTTVSILTSTAFALTLQDRETKPSSAVVSGSQHVWNLAGEKFRMHQPGDYDLLRMPLDRMKPALINLRGTFVAAEEAPCGLSMENFSLYGEWLGGKVVHVRSGESFEVKVSSQEPAFAGTWKSIQHFVASPSGILALPETLEVTKMVGGAPAFKFHLGPKEVQKRPMVLVAQAPHHGLKVSVFNTRGLDTRKLGGLFGTEKHDASVGVPTLECESARGEQSLLRKHQHSHSTGVDKHIQNLAGQRFDVQQPGDYELLRVPRASKKSLVDLRGTFVASNHSPCHLHMKRLTFNGKWLGGKVVHVRADENGFEVRVSSADPPVAGMWKPMRNFTLAVSGPEALPETIQITKAPQGLALRFRIGDKKVEKRPLILVGQGPHEGLDLSLFSLKLFEEPELGGLLGTDKHNKTLETRKLDCKSIRTSSSEPHRGQPASAVPPTSNLLASWHEPEAVM